MSLSVILIEDIAEFRTKFARTVLDAPDMRLAGTAENLAEGMALLERGPVDVLLVDLGLPDGSGLTLIREVARRWPDTCDVMVISVFADERHVMAAIEAGATGYLLKDASPDDLASQIRELHAGGSPVSPIIARQLLLRLSSAPVVSSVADNDSGLTAQERRCYRISPTQPDFQSCTSNLNPRINSRPTSASSRLSTSNRPERGNLPIRPGRAESIPRAA